jgi:hypothetical protein
MKMNLIIDFDPETIALFELTLLGQETFLLEGKKGYLIIPFYKLGYYDASKGLSHTYNLGYLIFEEVTNYKIRVLPHIDKSINYDEDVKYEMQLIDFESLNKILLEDIGFRTTGFVSTSINVDYFRLHVAYDFISPDCSPTNYTEVIKNIEISDFLLLHNLKNLHYLIHEIRKMG